MYPLNTYAVYCKLFENQFKIGSSLQLFGSLLSIGVSTLTESWAKQGKRAAFENRFPYLNSLKCVQNRAHFLWVVASFKIFPWEDRMIIQFSVIFSRIDSAVICIVWQNELDLGRMILLEKETNHFRNFSYWFTKKKNAGKNVEDSFNKVSFDTCKDDNGRSLYIIHQNRVQKSLLIGSRKKSRIRNLMPHSFTTLGARYVFSPLLGQRSTETAAPALPYEWRCILSLVE